MKLLLIVNYTVPSAYQRQALMLVPRIEAIGHSVQVLDIRAGGGAMANVGGVTVVPTALDPMGNDMVGETYNRAGFDAVLTLSDVWGFSPEVMRGVRWWPITPVDHSPVPPACQNALTAAHGVIALTRFGQSQLVKIGIDALYMPHGLDPAVWYPALDRKAQTSARRRLRLPEDVFLVSFVGVNDSNPSRKGIPEFLAAWALFNKAHKDILAYLHTTRLGNVPVAGPKNGVDIDAIFRTFGINPGSIIMPDEYRLRTGIPALELADIARSSDVFCLPSRGEGFGVPLIEFQHAGCPVITTDFGGGVELCASGWLVDWEMEWSWQNSTIARPGIASILERLEEAYAAWGDNRRRVQAAEFARQYEIDVVCQKYTAPVLDMIAQRVMSEVKVA